MASHRRRCEANGALSETLDRARGESKGFFTPGCAQQHFGRASPVLRGEGCPPAHPGVVTPCLAVAVSGQSSPTSLVHSVPDDGPA